MKKLLLVSMNSVHTYHFIRLIEGYFDEILLLTNTVNPDYAGKTKTVNFSISKPIQLLKTVPSIKNIIHEFQPSIIHIHQANTAAWLTLQAAGNLKKKTIVTAWGSDILLHPKRGFFYRKMVEQILASAGYFTADARFLAESMNALSKRHLPIAIINFGIDPICTTFEELSPLLVKKENIIYSNRLHKKLYRIDHIMHAFAEFVKSQDKPWKMVIAATGEETGNLQKLAADLGILEQLIFAGWIGREENTAWYRAAKIFVSYPESDATSVSLLEAMSAGCIPVLSDLPANKEWVTHEKNGIITAQLSAADFEKALPLFKENILLANLNEMLLHATKAHSRKLFFDLYDSVTAAT